LSFIPLAITQCDLMGIARCHVELTESAYGNNHTYCC